MTDELLCLIIHHIVISGSSSKPYCLEPKSYSAATSLPGFYSAYPPTPPKDSANDDPSRPSDDYLQPALPSSNDDLLGTSELKPSPESLMSFPSFPYTSRKIQEGSAAEGLHDPAVAYPEPCGSPTISYSYYSAAPPDGAGGGPGGSPLYYTGSSPFNAKGGLQSPRQRAKVRTNAGKRGMLPRNHIKK